jgi:hypothetical protein
MSSEFIDPNAPSLRGGFPRDPKDLPHGFIPPPQEVREALAREFAKHSNLSQESKERTLIYWTLAYYFDYLCHEVLYRPTPEGPDVVAVGFDEIFAFRKGMPLEEQLKFKKWLPY